MTQWHTGSDSTSTISALPMPILAFVACNLLAIILLVILMKFAIKWAQAPTIKKQTGDTEIMAGRVVCRILSENTLANLFLVRYAYHALIAISPIMIWLTIGLYSTPFGISDIKDKKVLFYGCGWNRLLLAVIQTFLHLYKIKSEISSQSSPNSTQSFMGRNEKTKPIVYIQSYCFVLASGSCSCCLANLAWVFTSDHPNLTSSFTSLALLLSILLMLNYFTLFLLSMAVFALPKSLFSQHKEVLQIWLEKIPV